MAWKNHHHVFHRVEKFGRRVFFQVAGILFFRVAAMLGVTGVMWAFLRSLVGARLGRGR